MPIPVLCACSAKLRVGDHLLGQHINCPKCGALLAVGAAGATPAAAPAKAAPERPAAKLPSPKQVLEQSELSDEEREKLEAELGRSERLLWAGKPVARVAYGRAWLMSIGYFFGAVVCAIIVGCTWGMFGKDNDHFSGILSWAFLGIPALGAIGFLVVGLAWPPLVRRRYERTFYAFTDKRALLWGCKLFGSVRLVVYKPAELIRLFRQPVTRNEDDVGNLVFDTRATTRTDADGRSYTQISYYGFFYVRHAGEVERLMREMLVDPFTDRLYE
jgi:hypothetical protein